MKSQINIIIDLESKSRDSKPQESKSRDSKSLDSKYRKTTSIISAAKTSSDPEKELGYKQYETDRYNGWWM